MQTPEAVELWTYRAEHGEYLLGAEFASVTATPEPASLCLLETGLLALAGFHTRKRRQNR